MTRNIKLLLEYDGTNFVGWQAQANGRSIQQEISGALRQVLQEDVNLIGAGRTDSGVHARGQVANFRTLSTIPSSPICNALNGLLKEDICVLKAEDVAEQFHARLDARMRVYRYYIVQRRLAVGRQYAWEVKYDLDVDLMRKAALEILGEHDFQSFCKANSDVSHYKCNVMESNWNQNAWHLTYEIRANRFLHGMVRALVGTIVDIGRGYTPLSTFGEILRAKDRGMAGMAAPPQGLFLEEVVY